MDRIAGWLMALAGSYLVGAIPSGYLIVRWLKRVDVRTVGSGSVGATNVARAAGRGASLLVFAIDVAKGLLAVGLLAPWALGMPMRVEQLACGLAAVVGHCYPIFTGFRGGKGVATTIGVLLGAMPELAPTALLVWVCCFAIWRYVSVGSIAAALMIPTMQLGVREPWTDVALGGAIAGLVIARHRANIERLACGQELRAGRRREPAGP